MPTTLPALLPAEPAEHAPPPPPAQFSRADQGAFLDALTDWGNVRAAARAVGVSRSTAYRMRRACSRFRALWDAALLSALPRVEEALADRALNGVEEAVYYHGEEVAVRRRYDARLLLAHLGRLDRLADRADVHAAMAGLDAQIDAFKRGEEGPEIGPEEGAQNLRQDSVSGVSEDAVEGDWEDSEEAPACAGAHLGEGPEQEPKEEPDEEPDEEVTALALEHWLGAMEAARPEGALAPYQLCRDGLTTDMIEAHQLAAFEAGDPHWWNALPDPPDPLAPVAGAHSLV